MRQHSLAHTLSPFLLARVSGVAPAALEPLVLEEAVRNLDKIFAIEAELDRLSEPLTDGLYQVVPHLDDAAEARHAALRLKRAIHNRRPATVAPDILALLNERLG